MAQEEVAKTELPIMSSGSAYVARPVGPSCQLLEHSPVRLWWERRIPHRHVPSSRLLLDDRQFEVGAS